jgi:signal transduction histidine kinase
MDSKRLHFDVSTGLKNVLGSELITDDEVAIFELVKNSYDANAKHVDIVFGNDSISIADNGDGMSLEDIQGKWLLVAYSTKRDTGTRKDFRQEIADRKHYAGSKGIGRFSSDRLGQMVVLQTKHKDDITSLIHEVTVDWQRFDRDPKKLFHSVRVDYAEKEHFDHPAGAKRLTHGTIITIKQTKEHWDRSRLLKLKSAMSKLINPFGASKDGFTITIVAPSEKAADAEEANRYRSSGEEPPPNARVNGQVGNFVFEVLKQKTTFIDVKLSSDGKHIESSLTDRGELIYRIREQNPYVNLQSTRLNCQIYFLNTSAKLTFARRMGVPSVQFGSIFLFRNGFRVYPVGEEGDDWFRLDRRKQQGYARFLGTRDVIGRIEVFDDNKKFEEASSRNQGLIENDAVREMREFLKAHCLRPLERYIVPVTYVDKEDRNSEDLSRLLDDPGRASVAAVVAKLVDNEGVELLDYSKRLIRILNSRSEQFEPSLASFRSIAEHTKDSELFKKIEEAEQAFAELRQSEESARKQADEERAAKEFAQKRAEKAEKAATDADEQLGEERKRSLFLASIASLDTDTILNLHHQITIYAVDLNQQIENFLVQISGQKSVPASEVVGALESISLLNRKVMGIAKFATKANFRLESEKIKADLSEYVEQYVTGVAKDFLFNKVALTVESDGKRLVQEFKPIDVSVVVDNLISNAKKAKATTIKFEITHPTRETVHIRVIDNGKGLDPKIKDVSRIFEKGFTTTDGSGLGLYHVQQVLGEMKGTIGVEKNDVNGMTLLIRIAK